MKYVGLGYDTQGSLEDLAAEDKRALHAAHRALQDDAQALVDSTVRVIAHYRLRPPRHTTTVAAPATTSSRSRDRHPGERGTGVAGGAAELEPFVSFLAASLLRE